MKELQRRKPKRLLEESKCIKPLAKCIKNMTQYAARQKRTLLARDSDTKDGDGDNLSAGQDEARYWQTQCAEWKDKHALAAAEVQKLRNELQAHQTLVGTLCNAVDEHRSRLSKPERSFQELIEDWKKQLRR